MQRKNDIPSSLRNRHLPSLPIRSKRRSRFARRDGPLSNASPIPISMAAYFKMINDQGGVNGRKITFISYDDHLL